MDELEKQKEDRLSTQMKKKLMLEAMKASLGNVSNSATKADISRRQHYNWLKNDPDYKEAIEDLAESNIDLAESMLYKNIAKGKEASIFFYLKTKAKDRGYIETNVQVNVNHDDLEGYTDEELDDIVKNGYKTNKGEES